MDGDLSLSQSLGGLRIANPDDAPSEAITSQGISSSPLSSSTLLATTNSNVSDVQVPPLSTKVSDRSLSRLDFDPSSFSTESILIEKPVAPVEKQVSLPPTSQASFTPPKSYRQSQSIPLTFQDQQQAQFPQYPTTVPQHQRAQNPAARPTSMLYPQQPTKKPVPARDPSYRLHRESSKSSISGVPHRSASRAAAIAMQAGVPSRESSHTDRSYRTSQPVYTGNNPLPPRKSSVGVAGGHTSRSPAGQGHILSLAGSPYGLEGGPLASSEDWQEKGAAEVVRREIDANGRPVQRFMKKGVKDFHFGRTLGEGSYSTVLAATDRQTMKEYAIKVLDKRHIIKEKKVKYVNIEKDTLNRLTDHPGVVRLYYTFQDERSLYFVLDIASGGELLGVLKKMKTFSVECTRFYGAQILDTIDYMHSRGVIHRDLKPENVLMDGNMHVKITDFGTAKILDVPRRPRASSNGVPIPNNPGGSEEPKANSFVGTAEYVSPELLTDKSAGKASDLWAFGCIIYQLLTGRPPFKASNEYQTFQKIVALDYVFPPGFPPVARDLVERLLVLDPSRRLTIDHVKNHEFFHGIIWGRGLWTQEAPHLSSYTVPTVEPFKLNGNGFSNGTSYDNDDSFPPNITPHISKMPQAQNTNPYISLSRPSPRVITELPPPSQLDIEWSPVLTRTNERILKLGNLLVLSTHSSNNPPGIKGAPHSDGSKFSRFFGGGAAKKRPRMVMVTTSGRLILAPAGGEKKEAKTEISLLVDGCTWKKMQDLKGLVYWCIDTHEKHYTFEDPGAASSDGSTTSSAAQEWLDAIERGRDIAISQSTTNSYSGDDAWKEMQSGIPSPASTLNTLNMTADRSGSNLALNSRNNLKKNQTSKDSEEPKGFKRFSKRQSKSGLPSVF